MTLAQKAVQHILLRMRADGRLAYLIGPGSEAFDLLMAAQADKQGIDEEQLRSDFEPLLTYTPWPRDIQNLVQAGIDRTTSGLIGQP